MPEHRRFMKYLKNVVLFYFHDIFVKYSHMSVFVIPSTVAMHLTLRVEWRLFDNHVQQYPIILVFSLSRTAEKWIFFFFLLLLKPVPKHYLNFFRLW